MPNQVKGEPWLPERQKQAYEKFYESTAKNEMFDQVPEVKNLEFDKGSRKNNFILIRRINTLLLSFRRKPGTCEALALSSGITGYRIKSGMTDFDYLIAGLIF
jgi:hypothetical protein